MVNNFAFEYPYIFVLIFVYILCSKYCKIKKISFIFPNVALLSKASIGTNRLYETIKFLIFIFLLLSLSSPILKDNITTTNAKGYEISLILDASGSMREANKFGIVKDIVNKFLDQRKYDKIALSLFADFAYVAIPLTYDKKSIKRLLSRLDVGVAGVRQTALYEALFLSSNIFKNSKSKNKIAILLTDGVDNVNNIPLNVAIQTLQKYGIKVYTIGIGSPTDYNGAVLHKIALKTKGKFFQANSIEKLQDIYKTINSLEKSKIMANKYIKKTYLFYYPLIIAILFMFIFLYIRNKD